jgi:hypothetical protein
MRQLFSCGDWPNFEPVADSAGNRFLFAVQLPDELEGNYREQALRER